MRSPPPARSSAAASWRRRSRRTAWRPAGWTPGKAIVTTGEHTGARAADGGDGSALAHDGRSAARRATDSGDRRLRRRHRATASRRRSAAAARIIRRRSSARAWARRRFRSGPTSTACSPPIRASFADVQVVPHLSFGEASELAYFGAKVLHPATIQPAVGAEHPGADPQLAAAAGSRRHADHARRPAQRSAADRRRLQEGRHGRGHHVDADADGARVPARASSRSFEQHRTSVDVVTTSEVSVSVTVDDARRLPEIMRGAARTSPT